MADQCRYILFYFDNVEVMPLVPQDYRPQL